eukprot:c27620_g1_i1 orf=238-2190(-)
MNVDVAKEESRRSSANSASGSMHTSDWVFSQDIPTDVTVHVRDVSFSLHKFPLVWRSGYIRKLIAKARDLGLSRIDLPDVPGGADAFELAAKFCYGINIDISAANVAALRCVGEYLEMSEKYCERNLIELTDAYINDIVPSSFSNSIIVLKNCENLIPTAEETNIVTRCVDAIASQVCREHLASNLSNSGPIDSSGSLSLESTHQKTSGDWWTDGLSTLRINFFERVFAAMRDRGLPKDILVNVIVYYAHRSLKGIIQKQRDTPLGQKRRQQDTALNHQQRILVETIVRLLPPDRNCVSVSFLFGMLRAAIYLDTTVACRLDLERRIGKQLEQATLDDLLIPSFSFTGDTVFDVDLVYRLLNNFMQLEDIHDYFLHPLSLNESDKVKNSPSQSAIIKVGTLVDCFLAEIAPDANLSLAKFISVAELLPDYARVVHDGIYRAIDIYVKAHPSLTELERKKLCSLLDCQKLSQAACTHATQNERLPVDTVVQVLYIEHARLRNGIQSASLYRDPWTSYHHETSNHLQLSQRVGIAPLSGPLSTLSPGVNVDYATIALQNRELKLEIARMQMHMCADLKNRYLIQDNATQKGAGIANKPSPKFKFLQSFTKKLSNLNPFQSSKDRDKNAYVQTTPNIKKANFMPTRRRRNSTS